MNCWVSLIALLCLVSVPALTTAFAIIPKRISLANKRVGVLLKGKGSLNDAMADAQGLKRPKKGAKQVTWTRLTGVTLPEKNKMKAWELPMGDENIKLAAINREGVYHVLDGACTKCSWDLWRGKVLPENENEVERVGCPLCGTTFNLDSGEVGGDIYKQEKGITGGFNNWVSGITRASTPKMATAVRTYGIKVEGEDVFVSGLVDPTSSKSKSR